MLAPPVLLDQVRTPGLGFLAFLLIALLLDVAEHRLALGEATGSIAFVVYIGAALVYGPTLSAVLAGVSISVAHLSLGKPLLKVAFNVSQHVVSLVAGSTAYLALGGSIPVTSIQEAFVPFMGFVVTHFAFNSAAVSGVVALSEGKRFSDVWVHNTWGLVGYDLLAGFLGLGIAGLYLSELGVLGLAVVLVPLLFLRHTYLVNLQLQTAHRELLDLMVKSIEARDPYTSGHSQRVSQLARVLAREIGLGFRDVDKIADAALLHDVGKIYKEYAPLLRKQGKLTSDERRLVQTHPARSAELVGTISNLRGSVRSCVRHHHENYDGSGYPDGLSGDDIPLGARIIMIADTVDAMTTDRPYRNALTYETVVEELIKYSGKQFDPKLVSALRQSHTIRRLVHSSRHQTALAPEERQEKAAAVVGQ